MLCDENRMPPPWGLPPVLMRVGGGEACRNELSRMFAYIVQPLPVQIGPIPCVEMKTCAKARARQSRPQILCDIR